MMPTQNDINSLMEAPGFFASAMSVSQIDRVIAEFISVRSDKMGWYESHV